MAEPILVVVPTCDRPAMLAEALASVLAQEDGGWLAVVADDGSRSPVGGLESLPRDPRIHLTRTRTGTPGGARNAGVAHGERVLGRPARLVAFLDDDDLWLPRHLATTRAALEARPGAEMAHGAALTRRGTEETTYHERDRPPFDGDILLRLLRRNFVATSSVLVRGEALRAVGAFRADVRHGEDWGLWLALARRAPVVFVPEVTVVHRHHDDNMSHRLLPKIAGQVAILESWWRDRADLAPAQRRALRRELSRRQRRLVGRRLDQGDERRDVLRHALANLRRVPHFHGVRAVLEAALGPRGAADDQSAAGT